MKIALGTTNPHKLEEINEIIKNANITDIEFVLVDGDFDPEENGKTFEENSYIKAKEAAKIMGIPALADDTGLCVDALNGRPGLYSARYAPTQQEKINKLLGELNSVSRQNRTAHFACVMTLVSPSGEKLYSNLGKIDGYIEENPVGQYGFGYDPIFFVPELNKTMAEMTMEEKNTLSHRARALLPILEWVKLNLK